MYKINERLFTNYKVIYSKYNKYFSLSAIFLRISMIIILNIYMQYKFSAIRLL